ncbi:MAG: M28 family peptidase [Clostridia bacterium]|nr:M28 family peptidase [Clostridia bacterium]
MNCKTVTKILSDTAYVRIGGTSAEKQCAEYLKSACEQSGLNASIEPFPITMYDIKCAKLTVDGKEITCAGYGGAGMGTVSASLYYLQSTDAHSLKKCKDKIVLVDKAVGYKLYDMLLENGAKGFITFNGSIYYADRDILEKEIRFEAEALIPAVNINIDDAIDIVRRESKFAEITLEYESYIGESNNVILDIKGETDETVVISAHYDSTPFSVGAYDNMSSCIGLLYLEEYFSQKPLRRNIRLLWCGSEERGLLGSLEYCRLHKNELKNTVLNINLDMLGSVLGEFAAFSCANEEMKDFFEKFFKKHRFPASVRYAIRSSDSNSFVHYGVPAVSFARYAPSGASAIHTRYDTAKTVCPKQLLKDMKIIAKYAEYIANTPAFSFPIDISEKIKDEVSDYMKRRKL